MKTVNKHSVLERPATEAMLSVLEMMGGTAHFDGWYGPTGARRGFLVSGKLRHGIKLLFEVHIYARLTPQVVMSQLESKSDHQRDAIPIIYAPTISERVAALLHDKGFNYLDEAGNCFIQSNSPPLFVARKGNTRARGITPSSVDPFSVKSSRIVRTLLTEPDRHWQVRELATIAMVSPALVVRVKQTLVQEAYLKEENRLMVLVDPMGLLQAWSKSYKGPAEEHRYYLRGDASENEQRIASWCQANDMPYALAGFSAASRLAPEVRYTLCTCYIPNQYPLELQYLVHKLGAKAVDSGANLQIWLPYDDLVLSSLTNQDGIKMTTPLQTYLDLKKLTGRGEEAAEAIYTKYLEKAFSRTGEQQHGDQ